MASIHNIFNTSKVVLPVVHVESYSQALRNVDVAIKAGADGAWLINHNQTGWELCDVAERVIASRPDFWIGINCLDWDALRTMHIATEIRAKGVWADDAGVDERKTVQDLLLTHRFMKSQHFLTYFGGVAFKHQRHIKDENLTKAASIASEYMDVVTTSGSATGKAADVNRIQKLKAGLVNTPLAIASGITPDNVKDYLPYADAFLVSTGISDSWSELNLEKTQLLVSRVKEYSVGT